MAFIVQLSQPDEFVPTIHMHRNGIKTFSNPYNHFIDYIIHNNMESLCPEYMGVEVQFQKYSV
jgi:hypothetical protein